MANGNFGGGDGSKRKPYLIEDGYDFNEVRNHDFGYGSNGYQGAYFRQVSDISLSMYDNWIPFDGFKGHYDGRYFNITDLKCTRENASLFGEVLSNGPGGSISRIERVYIVEALIDGESGGASIFANSLSYAVVTDCKVSGSLVGVGTLYAFCNNVSASIVLRCSVDDVYIKPGPRGASGFCGGIGREVLGVLPIVKDCYSTTRAESDGVPWFGFAPFYMYGNGRGVEPSIINCYASTKTSGFEVDSLNLFDDLDDRAIPVVESCYSNISNGFKEVQWQLDEDYGDRYNTFVFDRSNEKLYHCHTPQRARVLVGSVMVINAEAEPGVGANWHNHWEVVEDTNPVAKTSDSMKVISNYIGWDFEDVWDIEDSFPFLREQPIPTESFADCERINITKLLGGY